MDKDNNYKIIGEIISGLLKKYEKMELKNYYAKYQLSLTETYYLLAIRHECITMSDLAGLVDVSMSTATVMVDKLVKKGFLERTRDEQDRRLVFIKFSKKGEETYTGILETRRILFERIASFFTEEEREWAFRLILKLHQNIDKISE